MSYEEIKNVNKVSVKAKTLPRLASEFHPVTSLSIVAENE
jgi:hypothetical protein